MKAGFRDRMIPTCHTLMAGAGSKSAMEAENSCTVSRSDNVWLLRLACQSLLTRFMALNPRSQSAVSRDAKDEVNHMQYVRAVLAKLLIDLMPWDVV